ncbi:Glycosyltransferase [Lysobacter silvestris]|uniref:Glycosyltransferase n=2 Tax=Solilutibacter silvestris TaxID=1645665 RepID=A0A2K1PZC6_9GAMM|nr:Glycosyltransferase [Lysobacter silvestris]
MFWLCMAMLAYAYLGYPLLLRIAGRGRKRSVDAAPGALPEITVVIAAHDEETRIAARTRDILAQDYPADRIRVIVVDDGSNDATSRAANIGDPRCRVITLTDNDGKASALNIALRAVTTPITVFADARQRFEPGTLRALVAPFDNPRIGAVAGELRFRNESDGDNDLGLYWRIERQLRHDESALGWLHGVSGAIHALRTSLFVPMPAGTLLDDMWLPLQVVFSGHRVWMSERAIAWDTASANHGEEFARKVRTLAGNWQLIARLPRLLVPWRNPVWFAWYSHKLSRLLAPWAMLAALLACAFSGDPLYRALFVAQCIGYGIALFAIAVPGTARRLPFAITAGTFLMLNTAALLSLPAAISRDANRLWKPH